jgi:hypothetical protein
VALGLRTPASTTSAMNMAAKARQAGGQVVVEPFDVMDSGRMAVLADPEGAAFCVWQARNHKGAKIVNEHGAPNFNGLATRVLISVREKLVLHRLSPVGWGVVVKNSASSLPSTGSPGARLVADLVETPDHTYEAAAPHLTLRRR